MNYQSSSEPERRCKRDKETKRVIKIKTPWSRLTRHGLVLQLIFKVTS